MTNTELGAAFFLALAAILVTCRLVGWLLRFADQPPVVGEMVAGVLLGPSLLGWLLPGVEAAVFPEQLRPVLYVVGQIGLIVLMFQAGYDFRTDRMGSVAKPAGLISTAGIAAPMLLGVGLTLAANRSVHIRPGGVSVLVSALFVGVALAITAFPMLARIIIERDLAGTRFGTLSLASGAVDDAFAWLMLAGVLSLAATAAGPVALAVGGTAALAAVLVLFARVRGRLAALSTRTAPEHLLLGLVVLLLLAAWYTDVIGLYAVFGAFSLGVVLPRSAAVDDAVRTVKPVATVFVPLFFTYSGLNTEFGLLVRPPLLLFTLGCVAAAIIGKFGACWLAARLVKEPTGVALRVGTLMNARGLMQLIAINVGLAAGIVTKELFSVLVVVALVTTIMASPLLSFWDWRDHRRGRAGSKPERAAEAATESVTTGSVHS